MKTYFIMTLIAIIVYFLYYKVDFKPDFESNPYKNIPTSPTNLPSPLVPM
jgi:hypothetical protein